jgi:hypothetical protein
MVRTVHRRLCSYQALLLLAPLWLGCGSEGDDSGEPIRQPGPGAADDDGGSDDDGGVPAGPVDCVETSDFFREEVWAPFMSTQCLACHNPEGAARHTDLVLQPAETPGYFEANLSTLKYVSQLEIDGESLLVLKASGRIEHGGNAQVAEGDGRYEALEELAEMLQAPVHCADDDDYAQFFAGVEQMDLPQALRRAMFMLASRYPTEEELAAVRDGGEAAFDETLRASMTEPGFAPRIMEIYNDQLLTDAYLPGTRALDLLDAGDYPGKSWFSGLTGAALSTARNRSNDALSREPLQLIRYIVESGRPFTDIVAADYTVANPFLARVYGVDLSIFTDPDDPNEWRKVQLESIPHAGVLTTPAFVNRYPTTETNRNRGRAVVTLQHFLATDVLRLGARPLDPDAGGGHNPTMNDPACTSCHDMLDPVAGTFANWDDMGRFRPMAWYEGMSPPGVGDVEMPADAADAGLAWLGGQIADDPRFARAIVRTLYTGLTGAEPADEPTDASAPDYAARIRAFEVQDYVFGQIADEFSASGFELPTLILALVKTPYFRATNVEPIDDNRAFELREVGASRLVSPEQLHRRIATATGYAWTDAGASLLPLGRPYHMMYGGMDSEVVTERLGELNGVMANVAERMANEVACVATAADFALPATSRNLLPFVQIDSLPGTDEIAIRDNLVYLHERLLGETLDADDAEIDRSYGLLQDLLADGQSGVVAGDYPATLIAPCRAVNDAETGEPLEVPIVDDPDYTVRAWMGVISAMLGDYGFLYE